MHAGLGHVVVQQAAKAEPPRQAPSLDPDLAVLVQQPEHHLANFLHVQPRAHLPGLIHEFDGPGAENGGGVLRGGVAGLCDRVGKPRAPD